MRLPIFSVVLYFLFPLLKLDAYAFELFEGLHHVVGYGDVVLVDEG